mmetsp:Transcript_40030/g.29532  ORF Transcript_40030/g.29532 Transcript_40030/m.29532 type:complete len:101 (+) Transcript_40030:222-524(+)
MPMYANTHSAQSGTGKQTIHAREEARSIIKRCCNASENDALIFVGAGCTSAVNLLVNKLRIKEMSFIVQEIEQFKEAHAHLEEENFCQQNRWGSYDCKLC